MTGGKGGFVNCESRGCDGGTTVSLLKHIRVRQVVETVSKCRVP
jgi:hypothetical protein